MSTEKSSEPTCIFRQLFGINLSSTAAPAIKSSPCPASPSVFASVTIGVNGIKEKEDVKDNFSKFKDGLAKDVEDAFSKFDDVLVNGFVDYLEKNKNTDLWRFGNGIAVGPAEPPDIVFSKYTSTAMIFTVELGSKDKVGGLGCLSSSLPNVRILNGRGSDTWMELEIRSGTLLFDRFVENGLFKIEPKYSSTLAIPSQNPTLPQTNKPTDEQNSNNQDTDWIFV